MDIPLKVPASPAVCPHAFVGRLKSPAVVPSMPVCLSLSISAVKQQWLRPCLPGPECQLYAHHTDACTHVSGLQLLTRGDSERRSAAAQRQQPAQWRPVWQRARARGCPLCRPRGDGPRAARRSPTRDAEGCGQGRSARGRPCKTCSRTHRCLGNAGRRRAHGCGRGARGAGGNSASPRSCGSGCRAARGGAGVGCRRSCCRYDARHNGQRGDRTGGRAGAAHHPGTCAAATPVGARAVHQLAGQRGVLGLGFAF